MTATATAAIALDELRAISSTVNGCTDADFARPTALPGWTVEELVRHLVVTVARQAEAYHRVRFAIGDPPADASTTVGRDALPAALAAATDHVAAGVAAVGDDEGVLVPLPFATLPPSIAAFVLVFEYGVHRYDLDRALHGDAKLAAPVADLMCDLAGLTLPALATPGPPSVDAVTLEPDGRAATSITWRDGAWQPGAGRAAHAVAGPSDVLALFIAGRAGVDDDRLVVTDPTGSLGRFKELFPGP